MDRQYQDSSSRCCCGRSEHGHKHKYKCIHQKDISSEDENECFSNRLPKHDNSCKNNLSHSNYHDFHDQSCKILSTLRDRFCHSKSETEEATTADPICSQHTYPNRNHCENASLLRRANDLINYAPESEFLKKIKQQCQYLQNSQPNIFFSIDEFVENDFSPYECQKCEVSSNSSSRQRGQLNSNWMKPVSERTWKCTCNQQSNMPNLNDDQVFNKNFENVQRLCKEFKTEKQLKEKKQANEKSKAIKKKSEHASRSKKPIRCGKRRKRKSAILAKCESNDQFEPTLKKPHENSCERCWRFASPSRSPVNKPDQKFDPNFRRGHSCTELEKGDGDVVDRESQFEDFEPIICNERERSSSPSCCPEQKSYVARSPPISVTKKQGSVTGLQPSVCTSTKVKELLNEQSFRKPFENYLPTARSTDSSPMYKTGLPECRGILLSDRGEKKIRPKSYSPGSSSPKMNKCPNALNDFDLTDCKSICMNPRKHFCDSTSTSKSLKTSGSGMPSTSKERPFSRGGSPSKSFDHSNLKPIPEAGTGTSTSKGSKTNTSKDTTSKTSKKPATGFTKSKGNQKPASSKAKNSQLGTKSPKKYPQTSKSQTNSSDKYKCPQDIIEKLCADKEKSQSITNSGAKEYGYNPKPCCGNTAEHNKDFHPIRDCYCFPRIPKSKYDSDYENGPIFCCHCNWGGSQKNETNKHTCKPSFDIHPVHEGHVRFGREPNFESNEKRFMKNSESRSCDCCRARKTSSPESSFVPSPRDFSGKMLSCPYREYANKNMSAKFSTSPENGGGSTWEKECQSLKKYQKVCEDKEPSLRCSPRKYFVYYMTKSKEKKRRDDVEVLVEEFGQACADVKDKRTKDISEKMKKVLESPSDSMALRFQKGVTETCKTPPSSRILYF